MLTESKQKQIADKNWRRRELNKRREGQTREKTGERARGEAEIILETGQWTSFLSLLTPPLCVPSIHHRQWCCQNQLDQISIFSILSSVRPPVSISLAIVFLSFSHFYPSFHFSFPHRSLNISLSLMSCEYQRSSVLAPCLHLPPKLLPLFPIFCCLSGPAVPMCPLIKVKLNPQRQRNLF